MKVSVYSQVYNTPEAYIRQCIESVLNQTFTDFEYVIIDNGCTDGTADILREYAAKDPRIDLIRFEDNVRNAPRWEREAQRRNGGEWIALLDSDDWIEPTFLERLLEVAEETGADIVCTGVSRDSADGKKGGVVSVEDRLYVDRTEYADKFPDYFWFTRFLWNKLYRADVFRKVDIPDFETIGLTLGMDTVMVFTVLKQARALVIDNSVLQHYRMNPQSLIHTYDPTRYRAEIFRFNFLMQFLSEFGPVSAVNALYLAVVVSRGMSDHISNVKNSGISNEERLAEYKKISNDPIMKWVYSLSHPEIRHSRIVFAAALLRCVNADVELGEEFYSMLCTLLPKCSRVITLANIRLLGMDTALLEAFLADDADKMFAAMFDLVRSKQFADDRELLTAMRTLAAEIPFMSDITTESFVKEFGDIYLLIWQKQYSDALDNMTGILFDGRGNNETFLTLYVSLTAAQQQVPAYIFGKVNLAQYYLESGRKDECRAVLDELTQMGVEETEEMSALRRELSK